MTPDFEKQKSGDLEKQPTRDPLNSPPAMSHEDALVKLLEVLSRRSQSLEVQDLRLDLADLGDWRWDSIWFHHDVWFNRFTMVFHMV